MPVFMTSTYESDPEAGYHDLRYMRLNNSPNHNAVHAKLAAIEGGEAGLVMGSGMAAISTTLLTLLRPGDHVLAQNCLYGGTHDLLTGELQGLGIEHTFFDGRDVGALDALVRPTTKVLYCETITNPLVEVADLDGLARFAKARGLVALIDNTFATPVNFRPLAHGFTAVLHSASKYLNGHSDIVAGALVGPRELVERVRRTANHLGGSLDVHACHLLHRGLKTLGLRVRHQNQTALEVAQFLAAHDGVTAVHYPGLEAHPDHGRARELFAGFGGMLAFEPKRPGFLDRVRLATNAPSLGGPETLVTAPAQTSHAGTDPATRRAQGISDALIRVSIGFEDPADINADFAQAL